MKNTKDNVKKFRKEFKIKRVPDLGTLKNVIRKMNYIPLSYKDNEALYYNLLDGKKIERKTAITILKGKNRYVFYDDSISENDLTYILAHEAAHIYLNHLNRKSGYFDTSEYKEREANEFASELLKCNFSYKTVFLTVAFLSALAFIGSDCPKNLPIKLIIKKRQLTTKLKSKTYN